MTAEGRYPAGTRLFFILFIHCKCYTAEGFTTCTVSVRSDVSLYIWHHRPHRPCISSTAEKPWASQKQMPWVKLQISKDIIRLLIFSSCFLRNWIVLQNKKKVINTPDSDFSHWGFHNSSHIRLIVGRWWTNVWQSSLLLQNKFSWVN